jgi:hypothetical protein
MKQIPLQQQNCLNSTLKKVLKEQEFQKPFNTDMVRKNKNKIIPLMLFTKMGKPFSATILDKHYGCVMSPFFRIVNFDEKTGCVILSVLIPIDMEGCPVDLCSDIYSLLTTKECITIGISCLCGVELLPPCLVNRFIPPDEHKC